MVPKCVIPKRYANFGGQITPSIMKRRKQKTSKCDMNLMCTYHLWKWFLLHSPKKKHTTTPSGIGKNATCGTVAFWKATSAGGHNGVFPSQWPKIHGACTVTWAPSLRTGGRMPTFFCGFAYSFLLFFFRHYK